ncbi:MAG: TRAP transporter small permease [Pseudomonadota bacterium]
MPRLVLTLARGMAVLGGLVLTGLILITCVSVLGGLGNSFFHSVLAETVFPDFAQRGLDLGIGPLFGDTEMVEVGMAFVIFCFLPLCQISGGHASVDIFSSRFPVRVNRALQVVIDVIFAAVLILIALRLYAGLQEKMQYNETTYDLQFPIWWSYAASLTAAGIAALVGVYVAAARVVEVASGRVILPSRQGMDG